VHEDVSVVAFESKSTCKRIDEVESVDESIVSSVLAVELTAKSFKFDVVTFPLHEVQIVVKAYEAPANPVESIVDLAQDA
jgi:hypothetical protein